MDEALADGAIRSYARALNVADQNRIQFWDQRGLTVPQLRVMFMLLDHDGQAVGELAETMAVRPATMTGLTARLVRQNLVKRHADPHDGRVVRITLTHEGRGAVRAIETASRSYLRRIFERIGDERSRALIDSLNEFVLAAEALQDERTAPNRDGLIQRPIHGASRAPGWQ